MNELVMHEWDVCRRTAEFFDNQLGRLREIGITSSVAIVGIALQFRLEIGIFLIPLNAIFTLLDRRSQRYLEAASSSAKEIESRYKFVSDGLTSSVRGKIGGKVKARYDYYVYIINASFIVIGFGFLGFTYNHIYAVTIALFGSLALFGAAMSSVIASIVTIRSIIAGSRLQS